MKEKNCPTPKRMAAVSFCVGVLFSLGLGFSGMLLPQKIIGFLDLFGVIERWDPTLAFVMLGAVFVHMTLFRMIARKPHPICSDRFHIPVSRTIDRSLVIGSIIFGVGWGVTGLCPGPGIASLATLHPYPILFVASMLGGMWLSASLTNRRKRISVTK